MEFIIFWQRFVLSLFVVGILSFTLVPLLFGKEAIDGATDIAIVCIGGALFAVLWQMVRRIRGSARDPEPIVLSESAVVLDDNQSHRMQRVEERTRKGVVTSRYQRVLAADGTTWVKHGPTEEFFANEGWLFSRGEYRYGKQHGLWQDFHENGQLSTQGHFENGKEVGIWKNWDEHGHPEEPDEYTGGTSEDSKELGLLPNR
ncbi:MAG: hypothetical protein FJ147_01285 [Deltaproteobacteria bacterium]|nr:hypothetical protein [Deltaproteobacteria bacterium]